MPRLHLGVQYFAGRRISTASATRWRRFRSIDVRDIFSLVGALHPRQRRKEVRALGDQIEPRARIAQPVGQDSPAFQCGGNGLRSFRLGGRASCSSPFHARAVCLPAIGQIVERLVRYSRCCSSARHLSAAFRGTEQPDQSASRTSSHVFTPSPARWRFRRAGRADESRNQLASSGFHRASDAGSWPSSLSSRPGRTHSSRLSLGD